MKPARCTCRPGDWLNPCGWCEAMISRAEENDLFDDGWTERDLDDAADAAAARDWANLGGIA